MSQYVKKIITACFILLLAIPFSGSAKSIKSIQYSQESPPLSVNKVKGTIYEVKGGSGANTGFYIGEKEVIVIDAKMNEKSAQAMLAEIKKLTSKPVQYVFITHSDGDHVNGLKGFPKDITVVSHHQARKDMDNAFKDDKLRSFLPDLTFSSKMKFHSSDNTIKLFHFGPAHTSCDIVIYFKKEKVAFLGDLIFLGRDPLIHRHKNGSFSGLLKTLKNILKLEAEYFLHGHGDMAKRSDIEKLLESLEEKQAKIKELIQKNKTLDEIKEFFGLKDESSSGRRWPSIVEVIYEELTAEK
ncbi:MAG: MBL fold metallo-hydrolase [Candidatus Aminicenantaceae bacterium]